MTNDPTSTSVSAPQRWWLLLAAHVVIAATVIAASTVAIRELFVPHTVPDLSAPQLLTWLIGWQVVWFSMFTRRRLASPVALPVGTAIEVTVLAVIAAVCPVLAVLLLVPWVWVVLVGAVVVTVAIAVRHIRLWRKSPAADSGRGLDAADVSRRQPPSI